MSFMRLRLALASTFLFAIAGCEKSVPEATAIAPGSVLQGADSKKVYLITDGKRHYIQTPATLQSLGVSNQVKSVPESVLDSVPVGAQIPPLDSPLIQKATTGQIFVLEAGKRRYIPDPRTFDSLHYTKTQVRAVPDEVADAIPLGQPVASPSSPAKN